MELQTLVHRYREGFLTRYGATLSNDQRSALNAIAGCRQGQYADIERFYKGRDLPLHWEEEQRAIVHFIKDRDESRTEIVEIPSAINFDPMATKLLENGYGEVECPNCNTR